MIEHFLRQEADELRWPGPRAPFNGGLRGYILEELETNGGNSSSRTPSQRYEDMQRTQDTDANYLYPLAEDPLAQASADMARSIIISPRATGPRPQVAHRLDPSSEPTTWPSSMNSSRTSSSGINSSASDLIQTVGTSLTVAPQILEPPEAKICRCKRHSDICDRAQYTARAEICQGCQGFFSWSSQATPLINPGERNSHLCRCDWHSHECRSFRDEFDAGKCKCCLGWMTFSDRADSFILKQNGAQTNDDPDLMGIMNWDATAT
jgi:hypothetical protein